MKDFPWFRKLNTALTVYHNYVKRINEIISKTPGRKSGEVFQLQTLLWDMELDLNIADQNFYEMNLFDCPNAQNGDARTERLEAGSVTVEYNLN